jgi:hypothetical protein
MAIRNEIAATVCGGITVHLPEPSSAIHDFNPWPIQIRFIERPVPNKSLFAEREGEYALPLIFQCEDRLQNLRHQTIKSEIAD